MGFKYDFTLLFACKTNQRTHWLKFLLCSWELGDFKSPFSSRLLWEQSLLLQNTSLEYIVEDSQKFGQLPCLPLGLLSLNPCSIMEQLCPVLAARCPCPGGQPWVVPAVSPCVLVAFFPPSKLVLQSFLFPAWVLITGPQWVWAMCPPSVTDSSQPNLLEWCQWRSSHRLVSQEQKATTRYFYTIRVIYPHFYFDLLLSLTVIMSHVAEQ